MSQWLESLSALVDQGRASVLVTIVEAKGSVPRGAGTKMIVTDQGIHYGTIGGGNLEYQCIQAATERLTKDDWLRKVQRFPLGASLGQCCGGMVVVLFEYVEPKPVEWLTSLLTHKAAGVTAELITSLDDQHQSKQVAVAQESKLYVLDDQTASQSKNSGSLVETIEANDFNVVVFGAGHVGRALVHVLSGLECEVIWVDSREAEFPETTPINVTVIIDANPEDAVESAPAGSYFIVLTHSHSLDQLLCEQILKRQDFRFCGLIGSKSKRMKFEHRLQAKSFSKEQIESLTCPIGLSNLKGKQPGHIAVAVAAQLLSLQEAYV